MAYLRLGWSSVFFAIFSKLFKNFVMRLGTCKNSLHTAVLGSFRPCQSELKEPPYLFFFFLGGGGFLLLDNFSISFWEVTQ